MLAMKDAGTKLAAASVGFVVTIITLFLLTAWDFQPVDLVVPFIFLVGIGVGFWVATVLHA